MVYFCDLQVIMLSVFTVDFLTLLMRLGKREIKDGVLFG